MGNTKRVLHVGCGVKRADKLHKEFRTEEWTEVRLDIDKNVEPDIVASITDLSMLENASFDAIWSSHNLEHLEAHQVPVALKEFRRVLKPTGIALITLPDLQRVAELVAQGKLLEPAYVSPAGPIAPLDILFGFRKSIAAGNTYMAHRTGFTAQTLGDQIVAAGFASARVRRGEHFDLWAVGYVTPPTRPPTEDTSAA